MKCSHKGHTLPHRLLLLLKAGNQTSRQVFPPLQYPRGIITSTYNLGGLSTSRENYHLSLSWGIITPQRGLSPLTNLGDYHPLQRIILSHNPGGLSAPSGLLHQDVTYWCITPICHAQYMTCCPHLEPDFMPYPFSAQ